MSLRIIFTFIFIIQVLPQLFAQSDTVYMNDRYKLVESKINATYYVTAPVQEGELWRVKTYYVSGQLKTDGTSSSAGVIIYHGKVRRYYENGKLQEISEYTNGLLTHSICYSEAGTKLGNSSYRGIKPYHGTFLQINENEHVVVNFNKGEMKNGVKYLTAPNKGAKEVFTTIAHSDSQVPWYKVHNYNTSGKLIAEGIYHGNIPWEGTFPKFRYRPYGIYMKDYYQKGQHKSRRTYDANGKMRQKELYKDGRLNMIISYSSAGSTVDTLIYDMGMPFQGVKTSLSYLTPYVESKYSIKQGIKQGTYSEYYHNGKLKERGHMENGRKDGQVEFYDPEGEPLSEGFYKEGELHEGNFIIDVSSALDDNSAPYIHRMEKYHEGEKIMELVNYPNGNSYIDNLSLETTTYFNAEGDTVGTLSYQGYFRAQNGVRLMYHNSGVVSERITYENAHDVQHEKFNESGILIESIKKAENGDRLSTTQYYSNGALKSKAIYENGYDKANVTYYDINGGEIAHFFQSLGANDGIEVLFAGDRIYRMVYYKGGNKERQKEFGLNGAILFDKPDNGKASFYNYWGQLIGEGVFKDGQAFEGDFYAYSKGEIYGFAQYHEGKRHGLATELERKSKEIDLIPVSESHYQADKLHGLYQKYYLGVLLQQVNYIDGLKDGEATFYDKDGILLSKGVYEKGLEFNGTFYYYNNMGHILSKKTYANGSLTSEVKYDFNGREIKE